ncbi:MAG: hypothetical protein VW362_08905 [Candidatus Nanopelagicales bacterium]
MKTALPWLLAGVLLGWIVVDAFRGAPEVVDGSAPLIEAVREAEAARDSAETVAELVRVVYEDSLVSWAAERRRLRLEAARARAAAERIAQDLRVVVDTVGVRKLDELRAAHEVEVGAVMAERASLESQVAALGGVVARQSEVIATQRTELAAWHNLEAERQRVNEALQDALRKTGRERKLLAIAAIGLAVVVLK